MATPFTNLCRSFNLDDYDEPSFEIILNGKTYKSNLINFAGIAKLEEVGHGLEKQNIPTDSAPGIAVQLVSIFEGTTKEDWLNLHLSKMAAALNGAITHATSCFAASFEDLENFKQGKATPAPEA
jgi:hypothetical protein